MSDTFKSPLARLATFKDYKGNHRPTQLSRMGFTLYSESGKEKIICNGCQFQPEDLSAEIGVISEQHQQFSPECEFNISNHKTAAVVEASQKPKDAESGLCNTTTNERSKETLQSHESRFTNGEDNNSHSSLTKQNIKDEHLPKDANPYSEGSRVGVMSEIKKRDLREIFMDYEEPSIGQDFITELLQQAKHKDMSTREARRETFTGQEQKFSKSNHADIIDRLVDAGLFYLGPTDNVRCFYCDGGLKNFDPSDDPYEEHKKWFSQCKYVQLPVEQRKQLSRHVASN